MALAGRPWAAVVVVEPDQQDASQAVLAGVQAVVPSAKAVLLSQGLAGVGPRDVVVAVGDQAARSEYPAGAAMVALLLDDPDLKLERTCVRVSPLPDAFFLMSKIRDLVPGLSTVAIFSMGDHFKSYIKYLGAAGFVSNTTILPHAVDRVDDLVAGLRSLPGKAQALWLAPDPLLLDLGNFKLIATFCSANKIALIAPVTVLARAGALAGIAPSAQDQGQAAGKAAAGLLAGTFKASSIVSDQCEVLINPDTARTLGLRADPRDGSILR
jgi:ABC-type uncharacterized transport system substrate-binding protein